MLAALHKGQKTPSTSTIQRVKQVINRPNKGGGIEGEGTMSISSWGED